MKRACPRLLSAVFLAVSLASARSQPLAVLTIRSYADLQQAATRFARSLNPDSADTSIEVRVTLDQQLGVSMRVPMKLFREVRPMSVQP